MGCPGGDVSEIGLFPPVWTGQTLWDVMINRRVMMTMGRGLEESRRIWTSLDESRRDMNGSRRIWTNLEDDPVYFGKFLVTFGVFSKTQPLFPRTGR